MQGSLAVVGYPNFHTRAMGVQESHGVDEHLALKECLAGINIARVVGFHQLFFMHYSLQKAFERRDFQKIGFVKGVGAVLQSQVFFRDFKVRFFLRLQIEESS